MVAINVCTICVVVEMITSSPQISSFVFAFGEFADVCMCCVYGVNFDGNFDKI